MRGARDRLALLQWLGLDADNDERQLLPYVASLNLQVT